MVSQELKKTLWAAADKLRSNMDAAEYKHIVLGLIFLKYVSDTFSERRSELHRKFTDPDDDYYLLDQTILESELEDRDYYTEANVFWVPENARWESIRNNAKQPNLGKLIDDALLAIEAENPRLKNILDKRFARTELEPGRLGELVDLISKIGFGEKGKARDLLGEVYEYFLGQFANAEGKKGGQFYTPASIVKVIVEMIAPHKGKVYDPCCGSGGMFVQSEKFIESHGGRFGDISIYGQEGNPTTWRLVAMNLAIRGIDFNLGKEPADTFTRNQHPDLRADYIMANPPFNISEWWNEKLAGDARWEYGTPPAGNANYAWLSHILYHLKPSGLAGVVLANGSMSSNQNNEGVIRKEMIELDVVDCMIALPPQLFFNTQIPACLWFLTKDKRTNGRDRRGEILFIDARKLGHMDTRITRVFDDADIAKISTAYHAWRTDSETKEKYQNEPGFAYVATIEEVKANDYILTPGRYVGMEWEEDSSVPFNQKMALLSDYLISSSSYDSAISKKVKDNLSKIWCSINWSSVDVSSSVLMENISESLFKSWFISFEPVLAKMKGGNLDGLSKTIADLFPSKLVNSDLGEVPDGWCIDEIGSLVEVVGGGTPSTKQDIFWEDGDIHWATPKDLSSLTTHVLLDTERKITAAGLNQVSSGLLPKGTVLLSSRAPIGYVAVAEVPTAINQGFIALKCTKKLRTQYVLHWILANIDIIKSRANGSTFQEISKSAFRPILVCYPSDALLKVFEEICGAFYQRIVENHKNDRMIINLQKRDCLLSVPEEERIASEKTFEVRKAHA